MKIKHIYTEKSIALLTVFILSGCTFTQKLFYAPANQIMYDFPERMGYFYEDVYFKSKDDTLLHGRFIPAQKNIEGVQTKLTPKGTVIHYHGNAQNLSAQDKFINWLPKRGFNVFTFDYRGYGNSIGTPTFHTVYLDSNSALDYLRTRTDIDQNALLVFGQSLGGNNAISVVGSGNKAGVRAVVIDSTFYSYNEMVGQYSLIGRLLTDNQYSASKLINRIAPIPLLMLHGTHDQVIGFNQGKALFKRAKDPKQFYAIKDGRHLDAVYGREAQKYQDIIVNFFMGALMDTGDN